MTKTVKITSPGNAFGYAAYKSTYANQYKQRGSASVAERRALFHEAKRRLEHGVPVEVLIRYVTRKLRTMAAYKGVVRHG